MQRLPAGDVSRGAGGGQELWFPADPRDHARLVSKCGPFLIATGDRITGGGGGRLCLHRREGFIVRIWQLARARDRYLGRSLPTAVKRFMLEGVGAGLGRG